MSKTHAYNAERKRKIRKRLFGDRDTVDCCFCSTKLSKETATLEHRQPLALGGSWSLSNLALACKQCNNERGIADFNEFRNWKRGIAKTRPSMGNLTAKPCLNSILDNLSSEFKKERLPD